MTTATVTRSAGSSKPATSAKRLSLADIQTKGSGLPNRYVLHGPEGSGKTSFGAMTPSPVFIQTKGETGLDTLIDSGRIAETAHWPECETFEDLLAVVEELTSGQHDFKTAVFDTTNGAERLCHEMVCRTQFNNKWGKDGFTSYQTGYEVSLADWRSFLNALDKLREQRRMAIVLLCHTKIKPFKNPEGADFDRYQPDMHDKTWSLTHKWADAVLFMNFETFTEKDGGRVRGTGGQKRLMYTERHAAYDAKNRMGLPQEIDLGDGPRDAWTNFTRAIQEARASSPVAVATAS